MTVYRFRSAMLFLGMLLMTFAMVSCEKEDTTQTNNPADPPETMAEIESYFSKNVPEIHKFTVSANNFSEIKGAKGTRIFIPANAFVDANGNAITGNVNFELQEITTPADMIFTQKMTSSGGKTLVSGGEFYMNAQQNGQDLQLAPGKEISIQVPTDDFDPQMGVFTGSGSGSSFDWNPANQVNVSECQDSGTITLSNYCFNLDTLINWINCDYFYNDPRPLTEVEIQVPSGYTDNNTVVMVYIPSINSVTKPVYNSGSYYIRSGYRLPVGLNVKFIGVHHDGHHLYYSIQNATIVNNHVEVLSFQVVTQAQLTAFLQSL